MKFYLTLSERKKIFNSSEAFRLSFLNPSEAFHCPIDPSAVPFSVNPSSKIPKLINISQWISILCYWKYVDLAIYILFRGAYFTSKYNSIRSVSSVNISDRQRDIPFIETFDFSSSEP